MQGRGSAVARSSRRRSRSDPVITTPSRFALGCRPPGGLRLHCCSAQRGGCAALSQRIMTQSAPLTVVIPAFNAEPYLGVTLDAIRSQTRPPERIIVVDDGSNDGTVQVARSSGVDVVSQDRRGAGAARNRGVQLSESDFVAFCNADDWFVPDKVERDIEQLEALGAVCLASDAWDVCAERVEGRRNVSRVIPNVLTEEFLIRCNPIICSTVVARRKSIVDAGGFDESAALVAISEYDLWMRMATREPIAYSHRLMTFCRVIKPDVGCREGFVEGVDTVLERVVARHADEPHFGGIARRRRADVRLDRAQELMDASDYEAAAAEIRAAQDLTWTWRGFTQSISAKIKR